MNDNREIELAKETEEKAKWGGMLPAGEKTIPDKRSFIIKVLLTLAICIGIWTVYRAIGGQIFDGLHSNPSMISDIFAKPILTVVPILICWRLFFKEKRAPVKFARKNMTSGIISALVLVSAFIFFLYSMELIFFRLFGVREAGFSLIPGWRYMGNWEFILLWLMFVASTGFAEEYEARGFLEDQLGRAMPLWKSIVITGFIFAAGHIPIFIFIHDLTFWQGFYYFIYLVPMSFFLSLYYHWSRNLPAVMIYHGLFDWMLSAIYVTAEYEPSYFTSVHVHWGIFFIASLFALGLNLILLYMFYRIFWKRDRPAGSLGLKFPWVSEWKGPKRRDIRSDKTSFSWGATVFALTAACILFSGLVMGFGAAFGTMDPMVVDDRMVGMEGGTVESVFDLEKITFDVDAVDDYASEGQTIPITLTIEVANVANVSFRLTWRDEPDADGTHTNEPDMFSLSATNPDGNVSEGESGQNGHGATGSVEFTITLFNEDSSPPEVPFLNGTGEWDITISVNAGDHEPIVPDPLNLRTIPDRGNDFTLEISYDYYG